MKTVAAIGRYALIIVGLLLVLSLAGNTLTYFNFDPDYSFLKLKQEAIATGWYLPAYYSHVLISGIILVAGFLQLFPQSSSKYKRTHRVLGYVYVMGILFFATPGGIVMSLFIGRGPWVLTSFITLSILWFYFTARAFREIRKKKHCRPQTMDVEELCTNILCSDITTLHLHHIVHTRSQQSGGIRRARMAKLDSKSCPGRDFDQ